MTDVWIGINVLGRSGQCHPLGVPPSFVTEPAAEIDVRANPSEIHVLEARAGEVDVLELCTAQVAGVLEAHARTVLKMSTEWPALPVNEWASTRDTLQLWMQIVGKTRMVHTPLINHWWNVPLYVTASGCTTSLIPNDDGRGFQLDFDFIDHTLDVTVTDGARGSITLEPMTVARFYRSFTEMLDKLGLHTDIWPVPVEIPGAIPFAEDETHSAYDARRATDYWRALVQIDRVLHEFRARFIGKASPVHLFWGGLDIATTRFSGRTAPPHVGDPPNCGPQVMLEAYSHEVSSAGYWPAPDGEGNFYCYAYPEPDGFRTAPVAPAAARYDEALGEFLLPYEAVRTAADPDATLLEFLQSTYEAAANNASWDRAALERVTD